MIYNRIVNPLIFRVREFIGRSPQLDSRIKIFMVDQKTMNQVQGEYLQVNDWRALISELEKKQPAGIFIDKVFLQNLSGNKKDLQTFRNVLANGKNISLGTYIYRAGLPLVEYRSNRVLRENPKWLPQQTNQIIYGPKFDVNGTNVALGHNNYDKFGYTYPLIGTKSGLSIHWGLTQRQVDVENQTLLVDGHVVPVDENGKILLNLSTIEEYRNKSRSLDGILQRARIHAGIQEHIFNVAELPTPVAESSPVCPLIHEAGVSRHWSLSPPLVSSLENQNEDSFFAGAPLISMLKPFNFENYRCDSFEITSIKKDDVVIIVSSIYTGTTSERESPVGLIHGSFMMTAAVNSALKGEWISYFGNEHVLAFIFCLLGLVCAATLTAQAFWRGFILFLMLALTVSIVSFAYFSVWIPWAFPVFGFILTSLTIYADKSRATEKRAHALQVSFEGMLDEKRLEQIVRNPEKFRFEPKSQVMTTMFIDVVGFSVMAEQHSPTQAFEMLRTLFAFITKTVNEHGGIVDRSIGDGMLCTFGYRFGSDKVSDAEYAEKAVLCALKIQEERLKTDWLSRQGAHPIFPLRIGINTGDVFAGDLGSGAKIDFTVIGHSVNFAQRLETACENYRIMCGIGTKNILHTESPIQKMLTQKFIKIKHHTELVEAFEIDPFYLKSELNEKRNKLCRQTDENRRVAERWTPNAGVRIIAHSELFSAKLIDFSSSGIQLKSNVYFAKGVVVKFYLDAEGTELSQRLQAAHINEIEGEVRWSWNESGKFRLGVKLLNLDRQQQEQFCEILRDTFPAKAQAS